MIHKLAEVVRRFSLCWIKELTLIRNVVTFFQYNKFVF